MKLSQMHSAQTHRVIVFGRPHTGKSLLAGKLAEHYKLLWIDMENGFEVLFQLPEEWQENIDVVRLPDTKSYPIAIETGLKIVKGKPVNICVAHGKDSCMICKRDDAPTMPIELNSLGPEWIVVWDSATQLTASAIAHITKNEADDYKMQRDDWGALSKLMDVFFSHIQQCKHNVIVISHETEAETEVKKNTIVPVAGSSKFSVNVAKFFDHTVYCERKNKKHFFYSSSTAFTNIDTGSRTNVAIENYPDAGLLPIFKPELFPDSQQPASKPTGGAADAASALARLKSKSN